MHRKRVTADKVIPNRTRLTRSLQLLKTFLYIRFNFHK